MRGYLILYRKGVRQPPPPVGGYGWQSRRGAWGVGHRVQG